MAGTGLGSASTLVSSILCSRQLGASGYGQMNALNSTVGLFALFTGMGLGVTATRYLAEFRERDPLRAGRIWALLDGMTLGTCLLGGAALIGSSGWLARSYFHEASLAPLLRISVLWLWGFVAVEVHMAGLVGLEAFRDAAKAQLVRGLVLLGATWVGLRFWGLTGAVWALVASVLLTAVYLRRMMRRRLRQWHIQPVWQGAWMERRILINYSLPSLLAGLVFLPFNFLANGVLARTAGMQALGILNVISQWRSIVTFSPVMVSKVALPILSSRWCTQGDGQKSFEISNWLNQLALWPVAVFLLFGAGSVLALNGHDYSGGEIAFRIMVGGTAVGFVGNAFGTLITSQGWFAWAVIGNLIPGLAIWLTTLAFGAQLGVEAMAWGYLIGYLATFLVTGYVISARAGISKSLWRKTAAAGIAMVLLTIIPPIFHIHFTWPYALLAAMLAFFGVGLWLFPSSERYRIDSRQFFRNFLR